MKRRTYAVQSAVGQNATAHAFNSAVKKGEALLKEYALAEGLTGTWRKTDAGIEKNDSKVATHGWRAYHHDATGRGFRFVVNLVEVVEAPNLKAAFAEDFPTWRS